MFTARAFRYNVSHPQEELVTSFQKAYDEVLRQHHNILIAPIFTLAMNAVPYRSDFYYKLNPCPREHETVQELEHKTIQELEPWLSSLEHLVMIIASLMSDIGW
jgi:hypothetical protein